MIDEFYWKKGKKKDKNGNYFFKPLQFLPNWVCKAIFMLVSTNGYGIIPGECKVHALHQYDNLKKLVKWLEFLI